ncbi:MAG: tetratricopeptide repeat protein [Chthoniobacteraceae bacterium]
MEPNKILKRIQDIEQELVSLRAEMAPRRSWGKVVGGAGKFLISYWALMSFMAAIATATYVKYAFNIDYFESYRNASAVKRLSEFHRQMGDEMFVRNNWKQALASYKAATAANPANTAAALGEVKASVFIPEAGQKFIDPGISASKIKKLRELYPDDPQVSFLEVVQAFQNGQTEQSLAKCEEVLLRHTKFAGGYVFKSYLLQSRADFKAAAATLEKLLTFDPDNGQAQSNLGYCYLFTGQTKEAMQHLELGLVHFPCMVNAISFAEACRMSGDLARAEGLIAFAERGFNLQGSEEEYFASGQWLWNFLPEKDGDVESPKNTITCDTPEQKRAVLRISQGMLAATSGDGKAAMERFAEVLTLEPQYQAFLVNKLRATVFAGVVADDIKAKMVHYAKALESPEALR